MADPNIPTVERDEDCTHEHESRAVVEVYLPEGCQALPSARLQKLCAQHFHSVQPINGMEIVCWYSDGWRRHFEVTTNG